MTDGWGMSKRQRGNNNGETMDDGCMDGREASRQQVKRGGFNYIP